MSNLIGKKFGRLTVIADSGLRTSNGCIKGKCKCDCGQICYKVGKVLRKDKWVPSCGCYQKDGLKATKTKDITGQKFGHGTALKRTNKIGDAQSYKGICQCDCGTIREVSLHSLTSGRSLSCGCVKSKGEEIIAKYLTKLNIFFYKDYENFKDCFNPKTGKNLKFDFYLPDYNCCIEYDGIQHFQSTTGGNNLEHLKETQYRDNIKNIYCNQHNIKLIRIPYLELNKINEEYLKERIGDL